MATTNETAHITLPSLPYAYDALSPILSEETISYHYGKHHKAYVDKLNGLIQETPYADDDLETIVRKAEAGKIYNNAAQIWNHTFYWNGLHPEGGGAPTGPFAKALEETFESLDGFKNQFVDAGMNHFGSGWVWLVADTDGGLSVTTGMNADNPLQSDLKPLLTFDLWEHAFYIDYRNGKKKYLDLLWEIVNWRFVEENYEK